MSKVLEYKGFQGSIDCDLDGGYLYGKILHITDLVDYSADTVADLKKEFHLAVDDYLALCAELGCKPDKPASGSFNVRIGPDAHAFAVRAAAKKGISLNEFVKTLVEDARTNKPSSHELILHLHRAEGTGTEFKGEMPVKIISHAVPSIRFGKSSQKGLH